MTFWRRVILLIGLAVAVVAIGAVSRRQLGLSRPSVPPDSSAPSDPESRRAEFAHEATVDWVAVCLGRADVHDMSDRSARIMATSQFTFYTNADAGTPTRPTGAQENQVVALSKAIYEQRLAGLKASQDAEKLWERTQWVIVFIGFVTTVLVSLSATEFGKQENWIGKSIRIFAIIFPALGTAAAAVNGFYSPRDEVVRASRVVAGLGQLHQEVAIGVWSLTCDSTRGTDQWKANDTKLTEWFKRFQDIMNPSASTPTDTSQSGASPAATGTRPSQTQQAKPSP